MSSEIPYSRKGGQKVSYSASLRHKKQKTPDLTRGGNFNDIAQGPINEVFTVNRWVSSCPKVMFGNYSHWGSCCAAYFFNGGFSAFWRVLASIIQAGNDLCPRTTGTGYKRFRKAPVQASSLLEYRKWNLGLWRPKLLPWVGGGSTTKTDRLKPGFPCPRQDVLG